LFSCAGAAWSSSVHVLGLTQNSAASAWSVHEVAAAVQPDAVGWEPDNSNMNWLNSIKEAAESAPMVRLVDRLMGTPLESYQQAHGQLSAEERKQWEEGLRKKKGINTSRASRNFELGRPKHSVYISGV
jgi:hypothetical protein